MIIFKIENIGNTREEVIKTLQKIGEQFPQVAEKITKRFLESIRGSIVKDYLKGQVLNSRTGKLSSSIHWWLSGSEGYIGTNLIYAAIHEYGGVITPKNVQWLTLPMWRGAANMLGGAREVPNAFFKWTGGKLMLYGKSKYGIMPYYLLRKSVTMPARPFVWPAIQKFFEGDAQRIAELTLDEEFKKVGVRE